MKEINRRDFLRKVAIGSAILSFGQVVFFEPMKSIASGKYDIGLCKSVKVKCLSEVGWFDSKKLIDAVKAAGGSKTNQWEIPWTSENSAGSCSLIDMETLDGRHHKFLLDTGWNNQYMDECFKREGIDKMLKKGEIEFLFISHEHMDHYWGLETVLKYNPKIKIFIPNTFYPEGMNFLNGAEYAASKARNMIPHAGELVMLTPRHINKLYKGCAGVAFDIPISIRVRGEQSLFFNIKDKGIVCVTGCCHQNILNLVDFGQAKLEGAENMYGLYGGLHIVPFGPLKENHEQMINGMAKYNFKKIACNHCTGLPAVKKMIELGYPVVTGAGRFGSKSKLYVGNGDEVLFA